MHAAQNMAPERTSALPPTARERGVIAPQMLAHVVLRTAQYKRMVAWYQTVLNAQISFANQRITFMTYDGEHHRVAIANMPVVGRRAKHRAGVDHIAFTYASLGDLLETHARLKREGIDPAWCINHGPTTSLYYEDPDGGFIELQVDNFDSIEALTQWAMKGDFENNPIGTPFDPSALRARLMAGESEDVLKRRIEIGPQDGSSAPRAYFGTFIYGLVQLAKRLGVKT
ncbi:VOC family protein [Oleomonas cavernae]|nr:VOC family protein [Oleomonas cavernae]